MRMANETMEILRRLHPMRRFRFHPQNQRGAGFGMRFLLKYEKDCRRMLHRSTKPEPHSERNITNHFWRNIAQIQNNQSEASAVQSLIRGAQCLIDVPASHPQ